MVKYAPGTSLLTADCSGPNETGSRFFVAQPDQDDLSGNRKLRETLEYPEHFEMVSQLPH